MTTTDPRGPVFVSRIDAGFKLDATQPFSEKPKSELAPSRSASRLGAAFLADVLAGFDEDFVRFAIAPRCVQNYCLPKVEPQTTSVR